MHLSENSTLNTRLPFTLRKGWLLALCLIASVALFAQQKTATDAGDKITIQIINAESMVGLKLDTLEQTKLIGNVQLKQGDNFMNCDSAYINLVANNVEAFGNVHILQPGGTQVQSDYLRYIGNTKVAFLKGNVKLDDGKNTLWSEDITYNLGTKIAQYDNGGTLQSEGTTVTSNKGTYNVNTKDARVTGDVIITDPQYNTTSEDLGYNTATKLVVFYARSVVVHDQKSTLTTTGGTYATKEGIAHFTKRTALQDKEQYLEGDKIDYNRNTGDGNATGNVIAIDTAKHTTLWSGYASYNEKRRTLLATIKPVLRQQNGKDSIFIRADTFFSAPQGMKNLKFKSKKVKGNGEKSGVDSVGVNQKSKLKSENGGMDTLLLSQKSKLNSDNIGVDTPGTAPVIAIDTITIQPVIDEAPVVIQPDTLVGKKGKRGSGRASSRKSGIETPESEMPVDTTAPRYYTGYHHVLIYSDSLQGRCDSISYSFRDSVMRMMKDPVVWSRRSQITGDTIILYTDSSSIKKAFVPSNAFIASQSGPDKAQFFDQVQGKTLTANFKNNTITDMVVWPAAQCIYFATDDNGAYLGVDQMESERMRVFFKDQKMRLVKFEQEPKHTLIPLEKADLPSMRLSHFKWLEEKRPKSRAELFQ